MATIADIAKRAKVGKSTVSRYFNNGYVSKEKVELIEKVIKELDYKGNSIARSLATKKSYSVALIIPSITNMFFAEIAEVVQVKLSKYKYKLLIFNTAGLEEKEDEIIDQVIANNVDAVIVATGNKKFLDKYIKIKRPVISLDRKLSDKLPLVSSNNRMGIQLIMEHLYKMNCKKLMFISSKNEIESAKERMEAFVDYAKQHSMEYSVSTDENFDREYIKKNLDKIKTYDGIVAWNDHVAIKVMYNLIEQGVIIPEELFITGYDDIEFSKYVYPKLTTVKQPVKDIAEKVVDVIMESLNDTDKISQEYLFENELVIRDSTSNNLKMKRV